MIGAGGLGHIGVQCLAALTAARSSSSTATPEALKLAEQLGADQTVVADGNQVQQVLDLTGGAGANVVLDFVAEQGAERGRLRDDAGRQFVLRHRIRRPGCRSRPSTSSRPRRNFVGNIVGTFNELTELMALAQAGKVTLHTRTYPLAAAAEAVADLDAGRVRGRAILVP